jgi:spore germination protein
MRVTAGLVAGGSLSVLAVVAALVAAPGAAPEPQGHGTALPAGPPPKVFAFVSGLGGAELARLKRVGRRIDVVAPNWYGVDATTGRLHGAAVARPLLAAAHDLGVAVWPTVNARTGGSRAWESRAARARIGRSLSAAATGPGATGVTLDMEELRAGQRAAFTALVREAAARVHAAGRRLAVYVPRPGPGGAAAYDWAALAAAADLVLCSGYNEHWAGGPPGPTTTAGGFGAVLDQALTLAGPAKAVPVVGAFGYRWSARRGGELVSSAHARALRRRAGGTATRSDGSERFRVGSDVVVYETAAGLRARAAAARAAGARWLGLFSLGREPAEFWRGLATSRAGQTPAA